MKTWIDELYLEIRDHRNRKRAERAENADECRFLNHLMEEIEKNSDEMD